MSTQHACDAVASVTDRQLQMASCIFCSDGSSGAGGKSVVSVNPEYIL